MTISINPADRPFLRHRFTGLAAALDAHDGTAAELIIKNIGDRLGADVQDHILDRLITTGLTRLGEQVQAGDPDAKALLASIVSRLSGTEV